jgi:hypothetical protein
MTGPPRPPASAIEGAPAAAAIRSARLLMTHSGPPPVEQSQSDGSRPQNTTRSRRLQMKGSRRSARRHTGAIAERELWMRPASGSTSLRLMLAARTTLAHPRSLPLVPVPESKAEGASFEVLSRTVRFPDGKRFADVSARARGMNCYLQTKSANERRISRGVPAPACAFNTTSLRAKSM